MFCVNSFGAVVNYVTVAGIMYVLFKTQAVSSPFLFGAPAAPAAFTVVTTLALAGLGVIELPEGFAVVPVGYAVWPLGL